MFMHQVLALALLPLFAAGNFTRQPLPADAAGRESGFHATVLSIG
jgi:hypothetical protein